jgi:TetR/AcrR family transcriptional regulator, mexJK operon transcriptional repressor
MPASLHGPRGQAQRARPTARPHNPPGANVWIAAPADQDLGQGLPCSRPRGGSKAARAAASKMTLYKHFGDKESLFVAVVESTLEMFDHPFFEAVRTLPNATDVEQDLRQVERQLMHLLMQPRILQLRRLVIGEAARFPELGRWAAERGPGRAMNALATAFEQLVAGANPPHRRRPLGRGQLQLPNHLPPPLNRTMFTGEDVPFGEQELDRFVDEGVRVSWLPTGPSARPVPP